MNTHPKTGLHYIVSFRQGPAYDDAMHLYEKMAAKYDWLECIQEPELIERLDDIAADERNFVVMWGVWAPRPPEGRKAMFTRVFSEALDEVGENMISYHRNWLNSAQRNIRHMDGAFGHTPWMAKQLAKHGPPGHVLPMGWDPELFGTPQWDAPRKHRFVYVGAIAGKRAWLVPGMQGALGDDMFQAKEVWGKDLIDLYNKSSAQLYLSHSDIRSFSTFRIWQMVASSAAMIAEKDRDCWPMTSEMYIGVPTITRQNGPSVARMVQNIPDSLYKSTARKLHNALASRFTIEKVLTDYLIPASIEIKENKSL
jgi:hypothetical protein